MDLIQLCEFQTVSQWDLIRKNDVRLLQDSQKLVTAGSMTKFACDGRGKDLAPAPEPSTSSISQPLNPAPSNPAP